MSNLPANEGDGAKNDKCGDEEEHAVRKKTVRGGKAVQRIEQECDADALGVEREKNHRREERRGSKPKRRVERKDEYQDRRNMPAPHEAIIVKSGKKENLKVSPYNSDGRQNCR